MRGLTRREVLGSLLAASAGVAGYEMLSRNHLDVSRRTIRLPNWDADGFKLALLADLHLNSDGAVRRAIQAIELARKEKPDVLLLGGDFVNGSDDWRLRNIRRTLEATAGLPCYGIMGNHDYWCFRPQDVIDTLSLGPMKLMRNQTAVVQGVTLAGLDDMLIGLGNPRLPADISGRKNVIALMHEPDYADELPEGISLQLSGHSHGGQVCLPFGIPIHTPKGARLFISGLYEDRPHPIYVTRGVGTTGPPYRSFCPPEVTILTLRS